MVKIVTRITLSIHGMSQYSVILMNNTHILDYSSSISVNEVLSYWTTSSRWGMGACWFHHTFPFCCRIRGKSKEKVRPTYMHYPINILTLQHSFLRFPMINIYSRLMEKQWIDGETWVAANSPCNPLPPDSFWSRERPKSQNPKTTTNLRYLFCNNV